MHSVVPHPTCRSYLNWPTFELLGRSRAERQLTCTLWKKPAFNSLYHYTDLLDPALLEELESLGQALKGARIAHVNATAHGGGVAEILHSMLPLYHGLGVDVSWLALRGDDSFFNVTKRMHNCLQGDPSGMTPAEWDMHAAWNRLNAEFLTSTYDAIIVHDPQPAALREFAPNAAHKWIWRSHIDTSAPEPETWRRLSALVNGFDASAFSLPEYAGPGLSGMPIAIMPPAIDPFHAQEHRDAISRRNARRCPLRH